MEFYIDDESANNSISVIEFFRNDFLVIKDFLNQLDGSPWDTVYMIRNNINRDDLVLIKKVMIGNIFNFYHNYLLKEIEDEKIPYNCAKTIKELEYLFFTDESYATKMFKAYISYLKEDYNIMLDTKNYFFLNIENVREILMSEHDLIGISSMDYETEQEEFNKKYKVFTQDFYKCVKDYINCKISEDDEEWFIKYMFSLAYAYIKYMDESDLVIDEVEEEYINIIDSDIDLVEYFYREPSVVAFIVEHINSDSIEFGENYDLRRSISSSQELFSCLDENYDNEFEKDILINDVTLENKLEIIMKFFKNQRLLPDIGINESFSNNTIKELIDGVYSIYEPLVAVGLDGRYQEVYRRLLMRKYIADVYEFLNYETKLPNHETEKDLFYSEMNEINSDWDSVCVFFEENYMYLMDYCYEYYSKENNYRINACIEAKKTDAYKKINKFNMFSAYRYLMLELRKVKQLKSVDSMNNILGQLKSGKINLSSFDNPEDICKIICLNVYERLIINDEIDIEYREIINILNNELNLTEYLSAHQSQFFNIIKLFKKINSNEITYENECQIRKKITDERYVKVLKRLNPYNE